jgi:hypothetical protein
MKKPFSNFVPFFPFLNFTFFFGGGGHFFTKVSLHFKNKHKIPDLFYTEYDLFQAKIFLPLRRPIFKFSLQEPKKTEMLQNIEECLF